MQCSDTHDLNNEDRAIYSTDFSRWSQENYELQIEEAEMWVIFLNHLSKCLGISAWFQLAGTTAHDWHLAEVLESDTQVGKFNALQ